MKQKIRLSEGDLNRIIHKCLNEVFFYPNEPRYYPNDVKTFVSCVEDFLLKAQDILDNLENECEDGDDGLREVLNIANSLFDKIYDAKEEIKEITQ